LFTLSGLAPLGAFLVLHAITNSQAVRGEKAFVAATHAYERVPALVIVELLLVYVPLLFHMAYGVWLMFGRGAPAASSPYSPPWKLAVRATGVVSALFLLLHLPELRFRTPGARPFGGQLLTWLAADLSRLSHGWPLIAAGYLLACACATFHFAAGSWGVFASTRFASEDPRAKRRSAWAAALMGAVLFLVFANTVVLHATGARLFGSAPAEDAYEPSPGETCPPPTLRDGGP
jgi:succinate dehydrogenase / fumarate reductase cytochrome b subunit